MILALNLDDTVRAAMDITDSLGVLALGENNTAEMQAKVDELSAVLAQQAAIKAKMVTPELA